MNSNLLRRSLGAISPQTLQRSETSHLLHALQAAPGVRFDGSDVAHSGTGSAAQGVVDGEAEGGSRSVWAHTAGVNCLAIDKFDGRFMVSGGSDSSIHLWDLESVENNSNSYVYRPSKSSSASSFHKFGITQVSFYPFDSLAFLSSSYDHTLKVYTTETLKPSASFDLDSVVYSHALSPIADHLLVACATQHPAVRLVDLRSGARAHSLAGHQGAVLSVAWSPKDEYILASGGLDGTARLWDIRRSAGSLGLLDLEDSVGVGGEDGYGKNARSRHRGKAHVGACNGVVWKDDGRFLVTAGHDERVRVWSIEMGANSLSHFGPIIKNTNLATLQPLLVPSYVGQSCENVMFYPNEKEVLMFDLFEGTLLKRLRVPGAVVAQAGTSAGQRNIRNRITALSFRPGDIVMYSAHSDGIIRAWKPRTRLESAIDKEEMDGAESGEDGDRKRKRQVLDEIFRDFTKQKISFI